MKTNITMLALLLFMFACKNDNKKTEQKQPDHDAQEVMDVNPDHGYLKGVDIHDINKNIDWEKVKNSDLSFIFIKATQGYGRPSKPFLDQWNAAQKAGLLRGAFHYYVPGDPVKAQLKLFNDHVYKYWNANDLPPALDLEMKPVTRKEKKDYRENVKIWLDSVHKKFNRKPIIYVSPNFAKTYLDESFSEYFLWQAEWTNAPRPKDTIWKEDGWAFWQYNDSVYHIPGFKEWVDTDYFNGTLEDLKKL